MKKFFPIFILAISFIAFSCSDNEPVEDLSTSLVIDKDLELYLKSSEFSDVSKNFGITKTSLDLKNAIKEEYEDINVSVYYIKYRDNDFYGELACVIKKDNSQYIYKSLFEDKSQIMQKDEGITSIYTGQKEFVVDFSFKKLNNEKTRILNSDDADDDTYIFNIYFLKYLWL